MFRYLQFIPLACYSHSIAKRSHLYFDIVNSLTKPYGNLNSTSTISSWFKFCAQSQVVLVNLNHLIGEHNSYITNKQK